MDKTNEEPGESLPRLSPNATQMLALQDEVLCEWEHRLRSIVPEAKRLTYPILINTFPDFYKRVVLAVSAGGVYKIDGDMSASEHGGERARLTNYNAQAIIGEYQLLRWAIFDVLKSKGIRLNLDEFTIVNAKIDLAIQQAVDAFALAEAAIRERLIAMVTHDLRNPLAAAITWTCLIEQVDDLAKIREMAMRVKNNLARVDAMITDMLDAAVFHSGERMTLRLEQCDLKALASQVCEQWENVHGPRFQLTCPNIVGVWDREALRRVIENLMSNAVKYGASGSTITLAIRAEHERMKLTVHNDGNSIPVGEMESIFQVFRRAVAAKNGDKQGWGIGLPYIRSVAEAHGGSVIADSHMDRGTTFGIDIPLDSTPYQSAPTLGDASA
jgi:signal transduction histidine kinase